MCPTPTYKRGGSCKKVTLDTETGMQRGKMILGDHREKRQSPTSQGQRSGLIQPSTWDLDPAEPSMFLLLKPSGLRYFVMTPQESYYSLCGAVRARGSPTGRRWGLGLGAHLSRGGWCPRSLSAALLLIRTPAQVRLREPLKVLDKAPGKCGEGTWGPSEPASS